MDPTAALNELLDALRIADRETAFDRLEALLDWLSKGGSFPQVPESQPDATYQGYTNRATWTVGLMLMNDQGLYLFCHRLRREAEPADAVAMGHDGRRRAHAAVLQGSPARARV